MPSLWLRGTKEMMQPCQIHLNVISLVARHDVFSRRSATEEMMQPCLIHLHLISLVARRVRACTASHPSTRNVSSERRAHAGGGSGPRSCLSHRGEKIIPAEHPSRFTRFFNMNGEGVSAELI